MRLRLSREVSRHAKDVGRNCICAAPELPLTAGAAYCARTPGIEAVITAHAELVIEHHVNIFVLRMFRRPQDTLEAMRT